MLSCEPYLPNKTIEAQLTGTAAVPVSARGKDSENDPVGVLDKAIFSDRFLCVLN